VSTNFKGELSTGQAIRDRRLAVQISQEWLARLANCSTRMLQKIEAGYEPGFSRSGGKSRVVSRIESTLDDLEAAA